MNSIKALFISTFVLSMSCLQATNTSTIESNKNPAPTSTTQPSQIAPQTPPQTPAPKQTSTSKLAVAPTYNAVEASRINKPSTAQAGDRVIEQKIQSALKKSKTLSKEAQNVNIVAANGIVSITGKIQSEAEKAQIEKIAKEVNGVKSVGISVTLNSIDAKNGLASDEQIQKQVHFDLQHNFSLSPEAKNLTVTVNEGKITLSGNVANEIEKSKVESLAKIVPGAKSVSNNTTVKK